MRDKTVSNGFSRDKILKCADGTTAEMKEKHFRTEFEKNKAHDESAWNSHVLRVSFKNESFARKYKVKIEKFLKDLLDEGEEFVVCHPTHVNDEQIENKSGSRYLDLFLSIYFLRERNIKAYAVDLKQVINVLNNIVGKEFPKYLLKYLEELSNVLEEFEGNDQSFHIDKDHDESSYTESLQKVPAYSSFYEDTLDCKEEEIDEKTEDLKLKPSLMTCFNCLGDHHMKDCPEKIDRARINANKKEILLSGSTVRYHTDDQNNGFKPGALSDNLREALGLKNNQLPLYIYHMRVIGYPPGWMNEAVFEKSGLSLFDSDGKAVHDSLQSLSETGTVYDAAKFVEFPGFNIPVPEECVDEWKNLNMPPLQAHQQLQEALKSPNIINSNNLYKRKPNTQDDVDSKKQKNVAEQPCSPISKVNVSKNGSTSPGRSGETLEFKTPDSKQNNKRHSMSISMSPGTPVLEQGNPYQKLPDADKFAQGITEHLPFENLPDAVGTFEKMRGVISSVQKKLTNIKKS